MPITVWVHETNAGSILSGKPRKWHAEQVRAGTHPCPAWASSALRSGFVKSQAVGVVETLDDFHSMTRAVFMLMRALGEPYLNDPEQNTETRPPERVTLRSAADRQALEERNDPRVRKTKKIRRV